MAPADQRIASAMRFGPSAHVLHVAAAQSALSKRQIERVTREVFQHGLLSSSSADAFSATLVGPSAPLVRAEILRIASEVDGLAPPPGAIFFPVLVEERADQRSIVLPRRVLARVSADTGSAAGLPLCDPSGRVWTEALAALVAQCGALIAAREPTAAPFWWHGRVTFEFRRPDAQLDESSDLASYSGDHSFSLGAAAALFAAAFDVELPHRYATVGVLDERGDILPYSRTEADLSIFRAKIGGLIQGFPAVSHIVVAFDDAPLAKSLLPTTSTIQVIGVRSTSELLAWLVPVGSRFRGGRITPSPHWIWRYVTAVATAGVGDEGSYVQQAVSSPAKTTADLGSFLGFMLSLCMSASMVLGVSICRLFPWPFSETLGDMVRDPLAACAFAIGIVSAQAWLALRTTIGQAWIRVYGLISRLRLDYPAQTFAQIDVQAWLRRENARDPSQVSLKLLSVSCLRYILGPESAAVFGIVSTQLFPPAPDETDASLVVLVGVVLVLITSAIHLGDRLARWWMVRSAEWREFLRMTQRFRRRGWLPPRNETSYAARAASRLRVLDRAFRAASTWTASYVAAAVVWMLFLTRSPGHGSVVGVALVTLGALGALVIGYRVAQLSSGADVIMRGLWRATIYRRHVSFILLLMGGIARGWLLEVRAFVSPVLLWSDDASVPLSLVLLGLLSFLALGALWVSPFIYFSYALVSARLPPGVLGQIQARL